MAGVKGRSGRYSKYKEMDILRLVEKSAHTLEKAIDDPEYPLDKKAPLALQIVCKYMPERREELSVSLLTTLPLDKLQQFMDVISYNMAHRKDLGRDTTNSVDATVSVTTNGTALDPATSYKPTDSETK